MENQKNKLFDNFPGTSSQAWHDLIMKDLKGADYDKKLLWQTNEGFAVQPFYRAENLDQINWLKSLPGSFPYVRGNSAAGNNWLVRQDIRVRDIAEANEKALDILMKGVDSLGFELDCKKVYTVDEIERLLKNIRADIAELNFLRTCHPNEIVEILIALVTKYNRSYDKIKGSVNFDPLARFARRGIWYSSMDDDMNVAARLIKTSSKLPEFRVIGVNGHLFTNAGAGIVQEVAFTLSMGAEYLTQLTSKGLFADDIAPKIKFSLAVGSSYFMEIAKFRALRLLWAQIVNAFGINDADHGKMNIHATNANWNLTFYDPYVNMLRTTTGSMSAILGSIDSFAVMPYNAVFEETTDFSERIARNQQLVLKEECYFDKIADPAAGSYYIENLTKSIVDEAWKLFLKLDEEGGFIASLRKGIIQHSIKESAAIRDSNIANKREILLGTNQYANVAEMVAADPGYLVFSEDDRTSDNAEIETIKTYRGAQAFERMRYKTDIFSKTAKRPQAWMFTFGNLTMRKARASFACNFFACAGFETIDNPGFETIEQGIASAKEEKPDIVVICSSDEEYNENAVKIFNALKNDCIVVLAGFPKELVDTLKSAGMQHFIHTKSNLLETLEGIQKKLGVA
ncbi:MAG: methylmalonyl-CoA mutase small subunit [Bacteroidales bacterium]|nr:methylmalonyl-CoA mutase small subunit [Bacteroidales bacterium]